MPKYSTEKSCLKNILGPIFCQNVTKIPLKLINPICFSLHCHILPFLYWFAYQGFCESLINVSKRAKFRKKKVWSSFLISRWQTEHSYGRKVFVLKFFTMGKWLISLNRWVWIKKYLICVFLLLWDKLGFKILKKL